MYDNYLTLSTHCGYFPTVLATFLKLSRLTKHSLRLLSRRTRKYSIPSISLISVGSGQTNRSLFTMFSKCVDFISCSHVFVVYSFCVFPKNSGTVFQVEPTSHFGLWAQRNKTVDTGFVGSNIVYSI